MEFTNLPKDFCWLLQHDMQAGSKGFAFFKKTIWNKPGTQFIIRISCEELFNRDGLLTFDNAINNLGWLGIRDRIAACFIHYQIFGKYPNKAPLDLIQDIVEIENICKSKMVSGNNRVFLYAFYKKMSFYDKTRQNRNVGANYINPKAIDIITKASSKITEIDWLFLLIEILLRTLESDEILRKLNDGAGLPDLLDLIDEKEQRRFFESSLAYGASTSQMDIFSEGVI